MSNFFKYFLLWIPMLFIAIANGAARDLWYKKEIGELTGHQISTLTLLLLFWIYIWVVLKKYPPQTARHSLLIGLFWMLLTLSFEFGFGFFRGKTVTAILHDYTILEGRVWLFIPLWIFVAPFLFFKTRR